MKIQYWFFAWFIAMIILAIITQPDERPDKLDLVAFDTTRSSELYFKNIRSFYYRQSDEAGGILTAYRLKSLFDEAESLLLPFVIYHNWRSQEAYIRLDTNYLMAESGTAYLCIYGLNTVDSLVFPDYDHDSQYTFARSVYKALESEWSVEVCQKGKPNMALSGAERTATKRSLTDYFKLLDKL